MYAVSLATRNARTVETMKTTRDNCCCPGMWDEQVVLGSVWEKPPGSAMFRTLSASPHTGACVGVAMWWADLISAPGYSQGSDNVSSLGLGSRASDLKIWTPWFHKSSNCIKLQCASPAIDFSDTYINLKQVIALAPWYDSPNHKMMVP